MKSICEECEIELNNFDDIIYEAHTKRCYCRNCGAYVGDVEVLVKEANDTLISMQKI